MLILIDHGKLGGEVFKYGERNDPSIACHQARHNPGVGITTAIVWVRCSRKRSVGGANARPQGEGNFGRASCLIVGAYQG